ncbi:flavin-containing monooxygenase [Sphingomonas baiyangensis]|uniref:NAD(P)/FAD-dependent oxidoreductase n=1 Tax=Sphingomonas baiyangensis TaxID=2572576 RepID=A0A4U1L2A8_9SPHN|nr:NAD(P)/FAD-dependent oxidoreductase [Sphingomonas baiyangensis]TKD50303.1 NAD(P)/FAD-dependent oxidoreductase [Sphingomonas baiyangensis]
MQTQDFDVIVVGAGLSGIGAAWHLQSQHPQLRYAVLEGRARKGGTWDLFRYPGIRSDSDMFTLGYGFRPWTEQKAIADGPSILNYVEETAREAGIDAHIRYNHRVVAADWSSDDARWTLTVEVGEDRERQLWRCGFVHMCTGYYRYDRGYTPDFAGTDDFVGTLVHPQFWPENLDYAGKRVVVIGSGATAVTLVPEMAKQAAHVTMLQRSPTYVVSRPAEDRIANALRRVLPAAAAYGLIRWRNVLLQQFFYKRMRANPASAKKRLLGWVRDHLGPDYDIDTHFTPRYDPWDQRLCLVPDADLFAAISAGRAEVVTDHVERLMPEGIRLASGRVLEADIIVTATGLELQLMSDMPVTVDGARVDFSRTLNYKGMMFSDVPNLAYTFGYTNASWTLKADLTSAYVCRLLGEMRARGVRIATPRPGPGDVADEPFLDFSSGYVQRAMERFPKQGARAPWKLHQSYARDLLALRFGRIDDAMEFSNPPDAAQAA